MNTNDAFRTLRTRTGNKVHIDMTADGDARYQWMSEMLQAPMCCTAVQYRMPTPADDCTLDEAAERVTCKRCSEIVAMHIARR